MARKIDLAGLTASFKDNLWIVLSLVQTKGVGYFKIPLLVGLGLFVFSYSMIYKPMVKSYGRKMKQLESLKAQAEYAGDYQQKKLMVESYAQRLPPMAEKNEYLSKIIDKVCRELDVVPDTISEPRENLVAGLVISSVGFRLRVPFKTAGEIIARLENQSKFMAVTDVTMMRTDVIGSVDLGVTVMTIFY